MSFEMALKLILEINEKFEMANKEKTSHRYFEVLYSSLFEIINCYTKEQYASLPKHFRATIEKLEDEILAYCSSTYKRQVANHIKKHGKFLKQELVIEFEEEEVPQMRQIGYIVENEELSI